MAAVAPAREGAPRAAGAAVDRAPSVGPGKPCGPMRKQSSSYDDEQVLMPVDPLAGDELFEQRLVEPARRLHVDILDNRVLPEAGKP